MATRSEEAKIAVTGMVGEASNGPWLTGSYRFDPQRMTFLEVK